MAIRPIAQGTSLERELLTLRNVPLDVTNDMALTDVGSALGKTAAIDILSNQVITPNMLVAQPPWLEPDPVVVRLTGVRNDLPAHYTDGCHVPDYRDRKLRTDCVYGDPAGDQTAMLIGDPHAAQWMPALDAYAAEKGWRMEVHTKSACPVTDVPVWERDLRRSFKECVEWRTSLMKHIRNTEPDVVFVGLSRDYELWDGRIVQSREAPGFRQERLEKLLTTLDKWVDRVVLLAETPFLPYDPIDCLADDDVANCDPPASLVVDAGYADLEQAAANAAGAELLSVTDIVCSGDSCSVVAVDGTDEFVVFRDNHHLTASYMERLAEPIGRMLEGLPLGDET